MVMSGSRRVDEWGESYTGECGREVEKESSTKLNP